MPDNSDVIFICVGTPTKKKSNSADLKYVYSVANELKKIISKYKIIITKSTVPVPDPHFPRLLTAFEAAAHVDGQDGVDVRPRVLDANTGDNTLLDSGSQVTVIKAGPDDIIDESIKLESVGGDPV